MPARRSRCRVHAADDEDEEDPLTNGSSAVNRIHAVKIEA
jgi:hypothetical protein